jgi:hypothetical protein
LSCPLRICFGSLEIHRGLRSLNVWNLPHFHMVLLVWISFLKPFCWRFQVLWWYFSYPLPWFRWS